MHRQVLIVHDASYRQRVKQVHASIVDIIIKLGYDLLSEGETLGHVPAFVVSSEHDKLLGVVGFDCYEEEDAFEAEDAAVDVVSEEEVVEFLGVSSLVQHMHQVIILPMNIPNHHYRLRNFYQIRFVFENGNTKLQNSHNLTFH